MAQLRNISCPICGSLEKRTIGKSCYVEPKVKQLLSQWQEVCVVQCK